MSKVPEQPKIYHITHVEKLPAILREGMLWSDAQCIERGFVGQTVGIVDIKADRLERRPVKCHPDTTVGQYVPFNLCPRSVMLYILHMGNREGLSYRGGQGPLIHLAADLRSTVEWAESRGQRWAISDRNAATKYATFYCSLDDLRQLNWDAIASRDWRDPVIKDGKQAEFLVYESFPWELVETIGVQNGATLTQVRDILQLTEHRPPVEIETEWYY
jgi:hypothetical protein